MIGKFFWSIGDAVRAPLTKTHVELEDEAVVESADKTLLIGYCVFVIMVLAGAFLSDRQLQHDGHPISWSVVTFFLTVSFAAVAKRNKPAKKKRTLSQPVWLKISFFASVVITAAFLVVWGIGSYLSAPSPTTTQAYLLGVLENLIAYGLSIAGMLLAVMLADVNRLFGRK